MDELTEEQLLRMERNRLEAIQKRVSKDKIEKGCQYCGNTSLDEEFLQNFHENICKPCKMKSSDFDLISRAEALSEYLIPEDALRLMKFQLKNNPHNQNWMPMKLFLRKNVQEFALQRFGSEEALEKEKLLREGKKFEKNLEETADLLENSTTSFRQMIDTSKGTLNLPISFDLKDGSNSVQNMKKRSSKDSSKGSIKRNKFILEAVGIITGAKSSET